MARAAGRKNYELRKDAFEYLMALFAIADFQRTAGQMTQFAATLTQIRQVIDESEGGKDEIDFRPHLALTQAQAGLLEDALTTVRSIRDANTRSQGYTLVATALAKAGRWREALDIAKKDNRNKNAESAAAQIMSVLIDTGRRDWALEAIPVLASGAEPVALSRLELRLENFEAARAQAQRLADPDLRLQMIEQIANELDQRQAWAELVTTARLIPADAAKIASDSWRHIHYKLAADWLIKGGALDDALTLLPRLSADDRQKTLRDIAYEHALAGDHRQATELMKSMQFEWRDDVLPAIAFAKVVSSQEKLDHVLISLRNDDLRLHALELLGESLPDSHHEEARAALRKAVDLAGRIEPEERDAALNSYASEQARRGFFDDAQETATRIKTTDELIAAYGAIASAQAALGFTDQARKTFVIAESQARKHVFTGEDHAQLTAAMAEANLLPEVFAQVQAMVRRDRSEYWFDQELDPVFHAHIKAGQLRRAFEIAEILSEHQSGNPHYFLVITAALAQ